jgi:hypothetical protein
VQAQECVELHFHSIRCLHVMVLNRRDSFTFPSLIGKLTFGDCNLKSIIHETLLLCK